MTKDGRTAESDELAMIREAHAAQPYEFKTDLTYCPSSDVPTDQCHTCIVLARLDRAAAVLGCRLSNHHDACDSWRRGFMCDCWRADLRAALGMETEEEADRRG